MEFIKIGILVPILSAFVLSCQTEPMLENSIIEIDDNQFEELTPYFEERTIVGIGEYTHGDGNLFELKTELIKYLHKNLDYDVVLMESDFLAVSETQRALLGNKPIHEAAQIGIAPAWAESNEYLTLLKYLKETASQGDTLHFHGFDPQLTGKKSLQVHLDFANNIKKEITNIEYEHLTRSIKIIHALNSMGLSSDSLEFYQSSIGQLILKKLTVMESRTLQWLKNLEAGLKTLYFRKLAPPVTPNNIPEVFSHPLNIRAKAVRDSMMADNVNYYLKNYDKIILWAANNHLRFKSNPPDGQMTWMGQILKQSLNENYYCILALYNKGKWSYPDGSQKGIIPESSANTLAHSLNEAIESDAAFLDLESFKFEGKMIVRNNSWTVTDSININEYMDAILFVKKVTGASSVGSTQ